MGLIVVYGKFFELIVLKSVLVLSGYINEFVRKNLNNFGTCVWANSPDFPLKKILLRVILNSIKRVGLSFQSWYEFLTWSGSWNWSQRPEVFEFGTCFEVASMNGISMIKVNDSFTILKVVSNVVRNAVIKIAFFKNLDGVCDCSFIADFSKYIWIISWSKVGQ